MQNHIQCPHCKEQFDVEQALYFQIQNKFSTQQQELAIQIKKLKEEEENFQRKKDNENNLFNEKLANRVAQEKEKIAHELQQKAKRDWELQMQALNTAISLKENENQQLQKQFLELLKQKEMMEWQVKSFEFEKQKSLIEERNKIKIELEEQHKHNIELQWQQREKDVLENSNLKIKELEIKLKQQTDLSSEMQRKMQQGSMQLQGEVLEMSLEEFLKQTFPFDVIEEVGKGIRGADLIQTVFNLAQEECGKIIYETKRTQNFSNDWIDKLRQDQIEQGAVLAILITQTMPKDMKHFGKKDGVWVCNFAELKMFIHFMRETIVREKNIKNQNENIDDKKQRLYNYLISEKFSLRISSIVNGFSQMKEDLEKEKRLFQTTWKKREEQMDLIIQNTVEMYGSIRGIGGTQIQQIQSLELPINEI